MYLKLVLLLSVTICGLILTKNYWLRDRLIEEDLLRDCSKSFKNSTFNQKLVINGNLNAENIVAQDINVNGNANLEESRINGNATVYGFLNTDECEFIGEVLVHGYIDSQDSKFNKLTLFGSLKAEDTTFNEQIIAYTKNIQFEDCQVNNIQIKHGQNDDSQNSIVILKGNTIVSGDIKFDSDGKVYLQDKSTIKGQVLNGQIIKN